MRVAVIAIAALTLTGCARISALNPWGGGEHGGAGAPHGWSYEGATGPAHWGELSSACAAGREQSPVDLASSVAAAARAPDIRWQAAHSAEVLNNGHTIQVSLERAGGVVIEGETYELAQVHFHHLSEHTVDGRAFPMEAHFVHEGPDGRLAVIGVFIEDGERHAALDAIWEAAPSTFGEAALEERFDPRAFLPERTASYRYRGSLTTPPCSEVVDWTVMATPIQASAQQIAIFAHAFPGNARPVQPIGRRFVLRTP